MPYTDISAVRSATGFSDSSKVSDSYITAKITGADGIINGKVGEMYALPFAATPPMIAFLSLELTTAILFIDQYGEEAGDKDKGWQKRMDFLMDQLEDIRTGKMKLYDSSGVELPRATAKKLGYYPTTATSSADAENSTQPSITKNQRF